MILTHQRCNNSVAHGQRPGFAFLNILLSAEGALHRLSRRKNHEYRPFRAMNVMEGTMTQRVALGYRVSPALGLKRCSD